MMPVRCDNTIPAFLCSGYHVGLLQEAFVAKDTRTDFRRHLDTYQVRLVFGKKSNTGITLCGGGDAHCEILADESLGSPWAATTTGTKWAIAYMIAKVSFGDTTAGESRTRAGLKFVIVCSIHLNNGYAKKTEVARFRLVEMFKACLVAGCTVIGGDFNAAAQGGLAEQCLKDAIKDLGATCCYNIFTEDCCLVFVLSCSESPTFHCRQCDKLQSVANHHLKLFGSDTDWHIPIIVHLRNLALGSTTQRQRGRSRSAQRKREKRQKYAARKAEAADVLDEHRADIARNTASSSNG
jgi:hypothetical protein